MSVDTQESRIYPLVIAITWKMCASPAPPRPADWGPATPTPVGVDLPPEPRPSTPLPLRALMKKQGKSTKSEPSSPQKIESAEGGTKVRAT